MTVYSSVQLSVAALCALMAAFHLGLWLTVRADRVQVWVAVSFLGYALVGLGIAGSSSAADGRMGDPLFWGAFFAAGSVPLFLAPLRAAELMIGRDLGPSRLPYHRALFVAGLIRALDLVFTGWRAVHLGHAVTAESIACSLAAITTLPVWIFALISGALANGAALEDAGRKSVTGWIMLIVTIPSTLFTVRELLLVFGLVHGPTFCGFLGIPFMGMTSAMVVLRYRRAFAATQIDTGEREISGYTLERRLGRGGMGELFLATRVGPGGFERKVALKRIRREIVDDPATIERFLDEARLAGQLRHPNVIAVQDVGMRGGDYFIAMEYLSGVTLDDMITRSREIGRPIPLAFVTAVGEGVARGLACAHAAGIVHRDIKPNNVMITFDGEVKVIDFGIAFEARREGGRITSAGKVIGTGPYLPPERFQGLPGEPPGDVYSLGVVLFEAITGTRPFAGRNPTELARSVLAGRFTPLSELRPEVPAALSALVEKSIAVNGMTRPTAELIASTLGVLRSRLTEPHLAETARAFCPEVWREEQRAEAFANRQARGAVTATALR